MQRKVNMDVTDTLPPVPLKQVLKTEKNDQLWVNDGD